MAVVRWHPIHQSCRCQMMVGEWGMVLTGKGRMHASISKSETVYRPERRGRPASQPCFLAKAGNDLSQQRAGRWVEVTLPHSAATSLGVCKSERRQESNVNKVHLSFRDQNAALDTTHFALLDIKILTLTNVWCCNARLHYYYFVMLVDSKYCSNPRQNVLL